MHDDFVGGEIGYLIAIPERNGRTQVELWATMLKNLGDPNAVDLAKEESAAERLEYQVTNSAEVTFTGKTISEQKAAAKAAEVAAEMPAQFKVEINGKTWDRIFQWSGDETQIRWLMDAVSKGAKIIAVE